MSHAHTLQHVLLYACARDLGYMYQHTHMFSCTRMRHDLSYIFAESSCGMIYHIYSQNQAGRLWARLEYENRQGLFPGIMAYTLTVMYQLNVNASIEWTVTIMSQSYATHAVMHPIYVHEQLSTNCIYMHNHLSNICTRTVMHPIYVHARLSINCIYMHNHISQICTRTAIYQYMYMHSHASNICTRTAIYQLYIHAQSSVQYMYAQSRIRYIYTNSYLSIICTRAVMHPIYVHEQISIYYMYTHSHASDICTRTAIYLLYVHAQSYVNVLVV